MDDSAENASGERPDGEESVRRLLERAGPRPQLPDADLQAIRAAARAAWREEIARRAPDRPRRPARALALSLAAVLILGLGLALSWWLVRDQGQAVRPAGNAAPVNIARVEAVKGRVEVSAGEGPPRPVAAGSALPRGAMLESGEMPDAGYASLQLASGSVVRLDAATRVRLVNEKTLALERGAVYLDTGGSATGGPTGARLAILTPLGTARDVGTRFAVRLIEGAPGARRLRVQVRDGSVAVEHQGVSRLAPAGQELALRPDGSAERRQLPSFGPAWDWVLESAGSFDLEGRSLADFLDWTARETGWRIRFAEPALAESARRIVLHGGLGALRPDRAPFVVLPGAGLSGEVSGGTLVIRRAP
ncbi:MAG TPA: FecR family protein [Thermoanaerobaculia bacterium]|nr:FecR family protein [Thermoanaerobaculia bacterium]